MQSIAVLLTCFNRKDKTLRCLEALFVAVSRLANDLEVKVYLTDDGSTDGTGQAVKKKYQDITVLKGTGSLYWNGGMRHTWIKALPHGHDGYLLLNDDTIIYPDTLENLISAHKYCRETHQKEGIYIGSTQDPKTNEFTYGGWRLTNKFMFKFHALPPNGHYQTCELGNANIMLVPQEVVNEIEILSPGYKHGIGDIDYTLKATKKNIPCLILTDYQGVCEHDHREFYDDFPNKTFLERWKLLNHPLGLDFKSYMLFMGRQFPLRVPFVLGAAMLKLFFPSIYINISKNR